MHFLMPASPMDETHHEATRNRISRRRTRLTKMRKPRADMSKRYVSFFFVYKEHLPIVRHENIRVAAFRCSGLCTCSVIWQVRISISFIGHRLSCGHVAFIPFQKYKCMMVAQRESFCCVCLRCNSWFASSMFCSTSSQRTNPKHDACCFLFIIDQTLSGVHDPEQFASAW